MIRKRLLSGIAFITLALSACNDNDLTVGRSLTSATDVLTTTAATFNVTTRTVAVDSVVARTTECYYGRIKDPETGAYITSDFMSQFHILETFSIVPQDSVVSKENDMVVADSCEVVIYLEDAATFCDSLAAMKMRVTELSTPVEEGQTFYSNYDPAALGLLRSDGLSKSKMFTWQDLTVSDTERSGSDYYHNIRIPINESYTDKSGRTFKNFGTYILQQYYEHPEFFINSYKFIHNVFPGLFFEVTDGLGFYSKVPYAGIQIHYRTISNDSVYNTVTTLAGTSEVLQTSRITNENDILHRLANDNTCTYLKSPAGLFTEVTIPVDDIMQGHSNDSLLAASLAFSRINNEVHDKTSLTVPQHVLLVCKDSIDSFFSQLRLTDSKTSYTADYNATANTNQYVFNNISALITHLAKQKAEGQKTDAEWTTKNPDWNKMMLIPVHLEQVQSTSYGTTTTTTVGVEHDLSISSTRLVGGNDSNFPPITLSVVFGRYDK